MMRRCILAGLACLLLLAGCHRKSVPASSGKTILPETGYASYYADSFNGRRTANGEILSSDVLTAAHKTLPFGTIVEVTNLSNNKKVTVRINDRGPFVAGRIIDLTKAAAKKLNMISAGVAKVVIKAQR